MLKTNIVSFRDTEKAFISLTDKDLKRSHFIFKTMNYRWLVGIGTRLIKIALALRLPIKPLIKGTIFKQFCGGETIKECQKTVDKQGRFGVGSILDFSVEGAFRNDVLDNTEAEVIRNIQASAGKKDVPFSVFKMTGIGFFEILEKKQKGKEFTPAEAAKYERTLNRTENICAEAAHSNVRVLIDAEESWIQEAIDEVAFDMILKFNKERAIVFNTYQMYRKDKLDQLKADIEKVRAAGVKLGVKLVRGAYMEKEDEYAEENGTESPIFKNKVLTDDAFNEGIDVCLRNLDVVEICSGTHNEYSNYYLIQLMDGYGLEPGDDRIYFAQLYGMGDHITYNLADAGYNVAKYIPYGPLRSVMPYLFRRAQENTSVADQASRELKMLHWEMERRGLRR